MESESLEIFAGGWEGNDTVCGWGSTLEHTTNIRKKIGQVFSKVRRELLTDAEKLIINDAGCGDLWWMRCLTHKRNMSDPTPPLENVDYHGYDLYMRPAWEKYADLLPCSQLNIFEQRMRDCHLIICRDVFIHFPNKYVLKALELFKQSGKFLLSTSYTGEYIGGWNNNNRMEKFNIHHNKINLATPPFSLGQPIAVIEEDYFENYNQKVCALWKLQN